jgi:hypothetical protein
MDGLSDVIESKILPLVADVAPLLASALGSPLAGGALELLLKKFDCTGAGVARLEQVITQDPNRIDKLKSLELENTEALAKISASKYQATLLDKEDARKYELINKKFLRWMAVLITIGFFGALTATFLPLNISAEEKNLLSILVGMLASKWQTIIDFFFGSST